MKLGTNFNNIITNIQKYNDILLVCHINPDADTIGSALALKFALEKLGKTVDVRVDGVIDGKISILYGVDTINKPQLENYHLVIAIDCSDIARTGKNAVFFKMRSVFTMCIDHHDSHDEFTSVCFIDRKAAATSELIYEVIIAIDKNLLDKNIALLLYSSLITDSGCFSFSNVGSHTMHVASKLLEYDIDAYSACYHFYKKTELNTFKLHNEVLYNTKYFCDNRMALIVFSQEQFNKYNLTQSSTEGAINKLVDISCVDIAISLTEVNSSTYKVSVRSKDPYSAANLCESFGGGGHKNAAGCQLIGSLNTVIDKIIRATEKELGV